MVRKIRKEYKEGDMIDLASTMNEMMSTLIVNICVGHGRAYDLVEFEHFDDQGPKGVDKIPIYLAILKMTNFLFIRAQNLANVLFPFMAQYTFWPWDA